MQNFLITKYLNDIFLPKFNTKFKYEARNDNDLYLKLRDDEKLNLEIGEYVLQKGKKNFAKVIIKVNCENR